ncbi:hypothetical protein [Rhodococcus wratislaviensis]|uniref:hypothetical protein n=1 Tax=Rhodococcus wratislaviensis TaxID=44752 RepID=UPI0005690AFB|nr:hypothetical protein [Rhodococcus wratislaviensis]
MNTQQYRRLRHRHRSTRVEVNRKCKHPDKEAELLIEFACRWIPYGGATEEEILVNFGMTKLRFAERLWQVIPKSNCDHEEIRRLASAYPHHRQTISC